MEDSLDAAAGALSSVRFLEQALRQREQDVARRERIQTDRENRWPELMQSLTSPLEYNLDFSTAPQDQCPSATPEDVTCSASAPVWEAASAAGVTASTCQADPADWSVGWAWGPYGAGRAAESSWSWEHSEWQ